MSNIDSLLARNADFAAGDAWHNTPRLPFLPHKGLYVITCIDPRTDPADFLGLEFGEAIVARTVGGRLTPAVIQDVAYIGYLVETKAPDGPYFGAAIIHHTDCGSGLLADDQLRHGFSERTGYDEHMLADLPVLDPPATVRADVERLLSDPRISPADHGVRSRLRRPHRACYDGRRASLADGVRRHRRLNCGVIAAISGGTLRHLLLSEGSHGFGTGRRSVRRSSSTNDHRVPQ